MVYIQRLPEDLDRKARPAAERRAGWELLRLAARRRGIALPLDIKEALALGPHGKPFLKSGAFCFNISHSRGLAVCAVEDSPVGVDVERCRVFSAALTQRICTAEETVLIAERTDRDSALTRLWTAKESHMKLTGMGMAQGITQTAFCALWPEPRLAKAPGPCFFHSQKLEHGGQDFWLTECCEEDFVLETEFIEG